jgi:hypothetical protein
MKNLFGSNRGREDNTKMYLKRKYDFALTVIEYGPGVVTCEERNEFDVRGSVHHDTIHTEKSNNRLVCRFG